MISDLLWIGRRTLKQEADALVEFERGLDDSFVNACEMLFQCKGTLILTGMGKSGLVARKWASTLSSTGTKAYFLNPAEAIHGDMGILRTDDVLIALSHSGETDELGAVLRHARELGIRTLGITGSRESSVARQVELVIPVYVSAEACPLGLAPMTSSTLMMALGDAIASTLMQMRGFTEADFARLHPGGSLGRKLWLRVNALMHQGDSIPRVGEKDSLAQVLIEMTRKRLGMTLVMEGGVLKGLITDGDLRRFFQDRKLGDTANAGDLMTPNPRTVVANALAVEAREIMETNHIHQLVVVEGDSVVGVIHLHDLLRAKVV